jgi:hypothetical protein
MIVHITVVFFLQCRHRSQPCWEVFSTGGHEDVGGYFSGCACSGSHGGRDDYTDDNETDARAT